MKNRNVKIDYKHLVFTLMMLSVWCLVLFMFLTMLTKVKEEKNQKLRDNFAPLSESKEIRNAYSEIKDK